MMFNPVYDTQILKDRLDFKNLKTFTNCVNIFAKHLN